MRKTQGYPLPFGVNKIEGKMNFSVPVPCEKSCKLLLYRAGETSPVKEYEMQPVMGEVNVLALEAFPEKEYEYNYEIDGIVTLDPYAKALTGRDVFDEPKEMKDHEVRGRFVEESYDWEGDRPLQHAYEDVIAYSLHVRGFTKHASSKVKGRGTFQGVMEKLPYLTNLGINQIQCMPIYDFLENEKYTNYWGYGPGYYFAPKASYAFSEDPVKELKDMVKACHRASIEVVLDVPFTEKVSPQMVEDCLRYYVMEYHVDGFVLDPATAPMDTVVQDPLLKKTKLMKKQDGFQTVMRRFLKGDEGMIDSVIWGMRHHSKAEGTFNYITNHNGFTLMDLVSYDGKHNERNGEDNQDGPTYNYSWNCGVEGPTRKKAVVELRKKQMRNAFFLVLAAQGTPCILAGDEFANTQKGNNNVYCQDNECGWLDWRKVEKEGELFTYMKELIAIRKTHPVLHPKREFLGMDQACCGVPDVSYHGESAWRVPTEIASRQLGIYYSGEGMQDEDCFIAYNLHWQKHSFALPALCKGKKWVPVFSTESGGISHGEPEKNQKEVVISERTITMFVGR
ncbi:MAG: alpha-amylase family glycosyl hydrolase [Lachnospiraceae bacterium]